MKRKTREKSGGPGPDREPVDTRLIRSLLTFHPFNQYVSE
jgi:hypothetical protein